MHITKNDKLLIASNNKGKVAEIKSLLSPHNVSDNKSAAKYDYPEPEENGQTFEENAIIKAEYYCYTKT